RYMVRAGGSLPAILQGGIREVLALPEGSLPPNDLCRRPTDARRAATALLLVIRRPDTVPMAAPLTGLVLVVIVWLSTTLLQMPRNTTSGSGFDRRAWSGLVLPNWVHTLAWSARRARPLDGPARAIC
ncbi:MAG: hypothetical protein M3P92_04480, partial [Actinomycetota bacterium]|nr:hypothetical protein [Actinomycetota bacterium]